MILKNWKLSQLVMFLFSCFILDVQASFLIEPYIIDIKSDQAIISLHLKSEEKVKIEYGLTRNFGMTIKSEESVSHTVYIKNLLPDETYFYKVNNEYISFFKTLPLKVESLTFSVIGHTHGTEQYNHYPDELLAAKLGELNLDFLIHTGDATYSSNTTDYEKFFFRLFSKINNSIPIYLSPGNHDSGWPFLYGVQFDTFKKLFKYDYMSDMDKLVVYKKEFSKLRFLFFSYVLSPRMLNDDRVYSHLKDVLKDNLKDDKFNIVVFGGAQLGYYNRPDLLSFLATHNTNMIFNGDGSGFKKEMYKDIPIYFVGTGGSNPHPILYAKYNHPYINLSGLDVTGKRFLAEQVLVDLDSSEKKVFVDSGLSKFNKEKGSYEVVYKLTANEKQTGINNLYVTVKSKIDAYALVYTKPEGSLNISNGLRSQYLKVKKGANHLVFPIPHNNPLIADKKITVNSIKLVFRKIGLQDNINALNVEYD